VVHLVYVVIMVAVAREVIRITSRWLGSLARIGSQDARRLPVAPVRRERRCHVSRLPFRAVTDSACPLLILGFGGTAARDQVIQTKAQH
jgi:hypothetical protein